MTRRGFKSRDHSRRARGVQSCRFALTPLQQAGNIAPHMDHDAILWTIFGGLVAVMMVLDLGVFHRRKHDIGFREAVAWSAVWIGLSLGFAGLVWWLRDGRSALEFLTGYIIEESLSVDNLFVFLLIFSYFRVAGEHQHDVLFWGILGAMVMRAVFILAGVALIQR